VRNVSKDFVEDRPIDATWIKDGEKYALIGLNVKLEEDIPFEQLSASHWVIGGGGFHIPAEWREWLGSIRADEVSDVDLLLISKMPSKTPDILDAENQLLTRRVSHFYLGLLLASTFAPAHQPVMLTGSRRDGEVGVRSQSNWETPIPCAFRPYPAVLRKDLELAAYLAERLEAITIQPKGGGRWRFFRTLSLYAEARTIADNLERLHQYCRCIEGLILPRTGDTKRQFKSRTELFIGPRHHDLMDGMYDMRSAAEHLHESRYLETFDREVRLDIMKKEAVAEHIARTSLARILGNDALLPHFANTSSLGAFWGLPEADRRQAWGNAIDPLDALTEFDPKYISNEELGAR